MNNIYHYYFDKLNYKKKHSSNHMNKARYKDISINDIDTMIDLDEDAYNKKIDSICNIRLEETYKNELTKEKNKCLFNIIKTEDICCLCGTREDKHTNKNHAFFKASHEYRCMKCNKFFYQHDHYKNPCFTPYKRL